MDYVQQRAQDQSSFRRLYINSFTQKISGDDVKFTVDLGQDFQYQEFSIDSITLENKFLNFYQSQKIDYRSLDFILSFQNDVEPTTDLLYQVPMNRFVDKPNFIEYINSIANSSAEHLVSISEVNVYPYSTYTLSLDFQSENYLGKALRQVQLIGGGWEKIGIKRKVYPQTEDQICRVYGNSIYDFSSPPVILINTSPVFGPGVISNNYGTHTFALQNTSSFGDKIFFTNTQRSTCNSIYSPGSKQSMRYLQIELLSCDQTPLQTPINFEGIMNQNDLELTMIISLR